MAVAELVGREAELRPDDPPKVNMNGIEEVVADKGYHSGAVAKRVKSYGVRSYISEKNRRAVATGQAKPSNSRRCTRTGSECGASTARACCGGAASWVERSFAHCYETGGMRRTHLRGHPNILKRQLIHVGAFNLSLILRQLMGAGTPREWRNRCGLLLLLMYFLLPRREGRNRLCGSRISMSRAKCLASSRSRVCRWSCRNSANYTTDC
jgi:hypothetical protein